MDARIYDRVLCLMIEFESTAKLCSSPSAIRRSGWPASYCPPHYLFIFNRVIDLLFFFDMLLQFSLITIIETPDGVERVTMDEFTTMKSLQVCDVL